MKRESLEMMIPQKEILKMTNLKTINLKNHYAGKGETEKGQFWTGHIWKKTGMENKHV